MLQVNCNGGVQILYIQGSEMSSAPTIEDRVDTVHREFVADRMGRIRQVGTVDFTGKMAGKLQQVCEKSLYHFCLFVLGRQYLTGTLHKQVCNWLMWTPPFRKLLLMPRRHAKTSIVSHGLPLHMVVQPEGGMYMPHKAGSEMRILLAGETVERAQGNMRVLRNVMESNQMFRGLWPHLAWEKPQREASKWNETALIVPRSENYPDPTIFALGVGAAVAGARHDAHVKDDLVSEKAANSPTIMETVIAWHRNTRALFDDPDKSLEFIIGTRWAVHDLYSWVIANDPSVAALSRSIIEDGRIIYPEAFTAETIERLKVEFGIMFPLMYMNNIGDPDLVDFTAEDLRFFLLDGNVCTYEHNQMDDALEKRYGGDPDQVFFEIQRGDKLSADVMHHIGNMRDSYLRLKGG